MIAVALGAAVALVVAQVRIRPTTRARPLRTWAPTRSARAAGLAVVTVGLGLAAPPLAPLVAGAWWARRWTADRQRLHQHESAVRVALPQLVDLLRLATTAGLSLPVAHPRVAAHVPPPVGDALRAAAAAADAGRPRADALLEVLSPLGDRARSLGHVLGDHLRYGVPLLPGLERLGLELRLDRRRAAELQARRVPIRLLAPLVTCTLPAFALLTVVPLLAASLEALPI